MACVISVFSGNGGTGKSFFACNLAYGLKSRNKRVLLVEASFGARAADIILGISSDSIYTFSDICLGECKAYESVIKSEDLNLPDFISAGSEYSKSNPEIGIASIVKSQSSAYDFIVFDLSSCFDSVFDSAVKNSDIAIAVTDDSFISVRNTSLAMVRARKLECKKSCVVLNNVMVNDNGTCAEDVADEIGAEILGIIPSDEYVKTSFLNSDPIYRYNTYAGRSLENICKRIAGESVCDFETGVSGGFFSKNKLVLK